MFDGQTTSEEVIEAFKPQIKGKTFVLIGAGYPSIGSQMATYLAGGSPAHILIASRTTSNNCRDRQLDQNNIRSSGHDGPVSISVIDSPIWQQFCASIPINAVREAAPKILAVAPRIDVLIHTAGAMATKKYTLDKQGIEFQLSANHIGGFLLTNLLVPALLAAGESRFVNLTSSGYRLTPFRFDDWNFSGGKEYEPWTAYGQAKTANILFAYGLGKRLKSRGLTATVVHPGYNVDTKLGEHLTWDDYAPIDGIMRRNRGIGWEWDEPRFKTFSQIAATSLIAALDPELPAKSPSFLQNSQVHEPEKHATDPESVEKLWKLSEDLVEQKFEY